MFKPEILEQKSIFFELSNSLKKYSSAKAVLKNNSPFKYFLTNHNFFIHFTYWFFFIWFLTVIFSILVPVNNTYFFGRGVRVIFETAFNYIFQSLYKKTDQGIGILSTSVWTFQSYLFLAFSIVFIAFGSYCFFCVQNFLWDLIGIIEEYEISRKKNIKIFRKFIKLFFFFSLFLTFMTILSLLYIKNDRNTIKTIIFKNFSINSETQTSEGTKIYHRELSISGFAILFSNIFVFFISSFLYWKYSSAMLKNNPFFFSFIEKNIKFSEENKNLLEKDSKIKHDIAASMKVSFGDFKKLNTPGYIAELENVNKYFEIDKKQFHALKNVNLKIKKGEFIVILGPSGSGKTTLLNILAGIDRPTNGNILIGNCDTSKMSSEQLNLFRRKKIGYIFQHYSLLPTLTAKENILMSQYLIRNKDKKAIFEKFKKNWKETQSIFFKIKALKIFLSSLFFWKDDETEINYLLDILDLSQHVNKYPHQLSGGQQQRVAIARAFVKHPQILFGDEPTGAIDHAMSKSILEFFYLINKYSKTTVIIITHNPLIAQMAKRVLYISNGRIEKDVINLKPKLVHEIKGL